MNQKDRVLEHLAQFGSITSMEAITRYKITRLSAVIFDLKHKGHDIQTETLRDGTSTWAKYSLATREVA